MEEDVRLFNLFKGIRKLSEEESLILAGGLSTGSWANRSQILFIRSEAADATVSGFLSSSINRVNLGMNL